MKFIKIIIIIIYILTILKTNYQKSLNIKGYIEYNKFKFKNNNNKFINNKIFKKKLNILYFGYSNCVDACPKIINFICETIKYIKNSYKYIILFISIDPQKDNCKILQNYLNKFNIKNIYGAGGNIKIIKNLAVHFRVIFKNIDLINSNKYKINHSNIIYISNNYININFIKLLKFKNNKLI